MSAAHMVTVQVDTYDFEITVSFPQSRQVIFPSFHITIVMVVTAVCSWIYKHTHGFWY